MNGNLRFQVKVLLEEYLGPVHSWVNLLLRLTDLPLQPNYDFATVVQGKSPHVLQYGHVCCKREVREEGGADATSKEIEATVKLFQFLVPPLHDGVRAQRVLFQPPKADDVIPDGSSGGGHLLGVYVRCWRRIERCTRLLSSES
jgi:hypothetical protein